MVKAVIFDFWGTLIDNGTYSPLKQTYQMLRVRMPFGKFVEEFEEIMMTKKFDDLVSAFQEVCNHFQINVPQFVIERLIGVWNKNRLFAKIFPDTLETLKALKEKGIKCIIVSNVMFNTIDEILDKFDLKSLIDKTFASCDTGLLKTNGLFEHALKEMKLKNKEVISVGDSIETDIVGAENAGITAYLIDRNQKREFEKKILSLKDILALVENE